MDLKGQFPQPVFSNIRRYRENSYNMGLKRQGQLRNLMIRHPDVKIDERSLINRPTVTKSPMASITSNDQNALSYFAAIIEDSVDTSIKTCDNIEEYMAFIGTPIPSPTELIIQELEVIHSNGGQNSTRDAHVFERSTESNRVNTKSFCFSISQDWDKFRRLVKYALRMQINDQSRFKLHHIRRIHGGYFYKAFATSKLNSDNISKITRKELSQFHHSEIQHAIQLELDGIKEKQVLKPISRHEFEIIQRNNKNIKILATRMIVTVKEDNSLKARLVAKGYLQKAGENFFQTFSPVVDRSSVMTLLGVAAIEGLDLFSLDVSQAFLQANMDEEVYIKYNSEIYKLEKALYGTKQASRAWNEEITQSLIKYGLKQSITDPCMFSKYNQINADLELHVAVSTDDLLGATSNIQHWTNFCQFISSDYGGRYKTSQVDSVIKSVINFNDLEIRRESKHKISVNLNS